ncbi:hypothetical protein [Flavisolibacter nicotianae]|uniref:hypothetical protein n=1 Tax=Flavisolibacter nicotianae TaxID=2364882 RepID=UPI0013C4D0A3|nr:hypothetical protein [Flavisolibacter nicotianae]
MSQEIRNIQGGERDINSTLHTKQERKNYEGFEGMNYEQFRQPYNPKHRNRNHSFDERNDFKRPDEG